MEKLIQEKLLFEKIRSFLKKDKDFPILRNKFLKNVIKDKKVKSKQKIENIIDNIIVDKTSYFKDLSFMKKFINNFYPSQFLHFFKKYNENVETTLPLSINNVLEIKKALDECFKLFDSAIDRGEYASEDILRVDPGDFLYEVYYLTLNFESYGKNIFYIDKNFYKLLQHMDIPDINLDETFFPHNAFLVSFEDLDEDDEFSIKEIFIEVSPINEDTEEIEKEKNRIIESDIPEERKNRYINYFEDMKNSTYNLWISFIIANKEGRFLIIREHTHIGKKDTKTVMREITYLMLNEALIEEEKFFESLYREENWFEKFIKDFEDKLYVLFQLLIYLRFIGSDKKTIDTAPKKLLERKSFYEETGRKKELQKIEKKLQEYSTIHIIGSNEGLYYKEELKKAGKSKRPHWRRGHWRILKHPRFKKTKTFVRPALIGKSKLEKEELKGHIYKN